LYFFTSYFGKKNKSISGFSSIKRLSIVDDASAVAPDHMKLFMVPAKGNDSRSPGTNPKRLPAFLSY